MSHSIDLSRLFYSLADVFDEGSEEIAQIASDALRRHASQPCSASFHDLVTHDEISALLNTQDALPCCAEIAPVMDTISWHYSGYDDGRISHDVALRMQTVELIGADGMIFDDKCRVGLFSQTANTDYVVRTHAAEELFVQLAGEAQWMQGERDYINRKPGARMHHASYEPHASRTDGSALIAVWVWAGDIGYGKYSYSGFPGETEQ